MSKFHFKDSSTEKSKNVIVRFKPEDDIVLKLPDKSGTIVTTNTINRFLQGNDAGNFIQYIKKPNIQENNAGIVDPENHNKPLLVASYRTSDIFVGEHENTEWEVAYDDKFENIVLRHNNKDDKLAWLPGVSDLGKQVYVRYRFTSLLEDVIVRSQWSDTISYKTPKYGALDFSIKVEGKDVLGPTIKSGPLRLFGEEELGTTNHIYTNIRVYDAKTGTTVHEKKLGAIREYTLPRYTLEKLTDYKVEVKYGTDNDKIPETPAITIDYKTPDVYVVQPAINYIISGSTHKLKLEEIIIINSTDTHTGTTWDIRAVTGDVETSVLTLNKDFDHGLSLDITSLAISGHKEYKAYVKFHTESMESGVAEFLFTVVIGKIFPIAIDVTENSDKLPVIKLSEFRIENDVDEIESITISSTLRYQTPNNKYIVEGYSKQYFNVNGKFKYNTPITITPTKDEYVEWYLEDEGPGAKEFTVNTPQDIPNNKEFTFLVKAIIHGRKYQTETAVAEFRHSLNVNQDALVTGHELNNMKMSMTAAPNIGWLNEYITNGTFMVAERNNEDLGWTEDNMNFIFNTTRTIGEGFTNVPIPPTLVYDKEYTAFFILGTRLGKFNVGVKRFKVDSLNIQTPTVTVNIDPISSNKISIRINGSSYTALPSGRPNSKHKKTYLKIVDADNTNIVLHSETLGAVTAWEKTFNVSTNSIRYNKNFTAILVYESEGGKQSSEGKKNFNTGSVPTVSIRTPTVNLTNTGTTIFASTSTFYVTGLEDKSHKATNWYLKRSNSVVWSSLNDRSNLTSVSISGKASYGYTYTVEAEHIASDGTVSSKGSKNITIEYPYTPPDDDDDNNTGGGSGGGGGGNKPPYIVRSVRSSPNYRITHTWWGDWYDNGDYYVRLLMAIGYYYVTITHYWSNGNETYEEERTGTTFGPAPVDEERKDKPKPPPPPPPNPWPPGGGGGGDTNPANSNNNNAGNGGGGGSSCYDPPPSNGNSNNNNNGGGI